MGLTGGTRPIDRASAEVRAILAQGRPGTQLEVAAFDRAVDADREGRRRRRRRSPSPPPPGPTTTRRWPGPATSASGRGGEVQGAAHPDRPPAIGARPGRGGPDPGRRRGPPRRPRPRLPEERRRDRPRRPRPPASALASRPTVIGRRPERLAPARREGPGPAPPRGRRASPPIDLEQTIDLDGDATATVEFKLPEMDEGLWRGHVEAKAGDDLPFDDRRYLALAVAPADAGPAGRRRPGPVGARGRDVLPQGRPAARPRGETYAKAPFDPRAVDLFEARAACPTCRRRRPWCWRTWPTCPAADAKALAEFVERGGGPGGLHRRPGDGRRLGLAGRRRAWASGGSSGPDSSPDRPWRLDRWEATHPILRPFAEPEHGDIRRPAFSSITRIVPDPSARVLARFRGGEPALLERSVGRGKVVWFASSCDRAWGDWPRGRMFLPMVHQMVAYASGLADGGPVRAELAGPAGCPGLVEADGIVRVVNPDPYESETARCTPEGVRRPLRLHGSPRPGPSPRSRPGREAGRRPAPGRRDLALARPGAGRGPDVRTIPRQPHGGLKPLLASTRRRNAKGTPVTPEPKFLRRFEQIRASLRRYQVRLGLAATVLAAATGLGFLAWSDYYLELPRAARGRRPGGREPGDAGRPRPMAGRPAPLVDPAEDRRRDRGPVPAARPAHPDRRPVRRPARRADRRRGRQAEPGRGPGGGDRGAGRAPAPRPGRPLAAGPRPRGPGGGPGRSCWPSPRSGARNGGSRSSGRS